MDNYEIEKIRDTFSRLFVLGIKEKVNLYSFTYMLLKSKYVAQIEKNEYDEIFNKPVDVLFYLITGFNVSEESSFGIYNDAYWCGQNYFDLHYRLNKSFEYIFLKFPLEHMINVYSIFHEMDFSSLVEHFKQKEKEKTILRLLCERDKCSLTDVSKKTGININTLKKINIDDEYLYNASFQIVSKIMIFFDVSFLLFVK